MHPADLEKVADRQLRRLPLPQAPQTLLPRVMAAVQALSARPWYTRGWFTWPIGWQIVTVATLIALTTGAAALANGAEGAVSDAFWRFAAPRLNEIATVVHYASAATEIAELLWRAILAPAVPYVFALVVLMCLACAAFGAALNHVVLGRMSEQ